MYYREPRWRRSAAKLAGVVATAVVFVGQFWTGLPDQIHRRFPTVMTAPYRAPAAPPHVGPGPEEALTDDELLRRTGLTRGQRAAFREIYRQLRGARPGAGPDALKLGTAMGWTDDQLRNADAILLRLDSAQLDRALQSIPDWLDPGERAPDLERMLRERWARLRSDRTPDPLMGMLTGGEVAPREPGGFPQTGLTAVRRLSAQILPPRSVAPVRAGIPAEVVAAHEALADRLITLRPQSGAREQRFVSECVGVGVGAVLPDRWKPGHFFLQVYATDRRAAAGVEHSFRGLEVKVDVIGPVRPAAARPRVPLTALEPPRPAAGGVSVGHIRGRELTGTLGCLVRDAADENRVYILSNNHVLALGNQYAEGDPRNRATVGDLVIQPGPDDGGDQDDWLATLARWERLRFNERPPNKLDAALAQVSNVADVQPSIVEIGEVRGVLDLDGEPAGGLHLPVQKTGRTTYHTWGRIETFPLLIKVPYDGLGEALFARQLGVKLSPARAREGGAFAAKGDSGALLLDEERRAVGLVFAVAGNGIAFVNPIGPVLQALSVKF
jgi:hypothetical protein